MTHFIDALISHMTLDEKIGQLNLLAPGGNMNTGAVVNTDVEQKIRAGLAGACSVSAPPAPSARCRKWPFKNCGLASR